MREILFRGKRIDNGEWVYGDLMQIPRVKYRDYPEKWNYDIWEISGFSYKQPVQYSTIGQYTGLTDKNGRKIFEGDIVNFEHCDSNYCAKIDYERCSYWIINYNVQFPAFLGDVSEEYLEIIGNVHDNPELLEVKQ